MIDRTMATWHSEITPRQAALIRSAPLFFVATADPQLAHGANGEGAVNLSPRSGKLLILSPHSVAFLDHRGSGNETARHVSAGGPMTLMACSFDATDAAIVRLYGDARAIPLVECAYADRLQDNDGTADIAVRQVMEMRVENTMTSCGYGVPVMQYLHERSPAGHGRKYKEAK